MANAGELLKAAGFGFEHVVANRVYITDGAQVPGDEQGLRAALPEGSAGPRHGDRRPARPDLQGRDHDDRQSQAPKQAFTTPAADGTPGKPSPTLSSAIKVGNRLYVVGHPRQQRRQQGQHRGADQGSCWRASSRTLTAAGFGWSDVVDGIVYITDIANFDAMNTGYRSVITKDFPARATVKAGLVGADGLVEIMFVASK